MDLQWYNVFEILKDVRPWPWQERFGDMLASGVYPDPHVPTGTGKTSVIAIWLSILIADLLRGEIRLPRRLAYVVNSRTIVDQASEEVQSIVDKLTKAEPGTALGDMAAALLAIRAFPEVGDNAPILVSTLRGALARDDLWAEDPSAVEILVGTVDIIGSRLMFSGYGDGAYARPQLAGLLGVDTLLVLDEAHLTPQFGELIRTVTELQMPASRAAGLPAARAIRMSATAGQVEYLVQSTAGKTDAVIDLDDSDYQDPELGRRLTATKAVHLTPFTPPESKEKDPTKRHAEDLARHAVVFDEQQAPVLVYTSSAKEAGIVAARIEALLQPSGTKDRATSRASDVMMLTGSMRGKERDVLTLKPQFRRFLGEGDGNSVYLVCTAAGEVGVDLDACHLVMDLLPSFNLWHFMEPTFNPAQRLAQRLGRLNRSGRWQGSQAVILYDPPVDLEGRGVATYNGVRNNLLQTVTSIEGANASVQHTSDLRRADLSQRRPAVFPLDPWNLDAMAATSATAGRGARALSLYLHGPDARDLPECSVVWRKEVPVLIREAGGEDVSDLIRRIEPQERLTDTISNVLKFLKDLNSRIERTLAKKHDAFGVHDLRYILRKASGETVVLALRDAESLFPSDLVGATVLLSPAVGGLSLRGTLDALARHEVPVDAPDTPLLAIQLADGNWRVRICLTGAWQDGEYPTPAAARRAIGSSGRREVPITKEDEMSPTTYLTWGATQARLQSNHTTQRLDDHHKRTRDAAERLATALNLSEDLAAVLLIAAEHHDDGKAHPLWQQAVEGSIDDPLAKSPALRPAMMRGYRHELGALLSPGMPALPEHLVVAHHAGGRPGLPSRSLPPSLVPTRSPFAGISTSNADAFGQEVSLAYACLSRQYGPWGLAYLEALLKVCDHRGGAAS